MESAAGIDESKNRIGARSAAGDDLRQFFTI